MNNNNSDAILKIKDVSKSFPGVKALDRVSLDIFRGTIHGIVGENGAGKSTLMKILSGVYQKDSGEIIFDGTTRFSYAISTIDTWFYVHLVKNINDLYFAMNMLNEFIDERHRLPFAMGRPDKNYRFHLDFFYHHIHEMYPMVVFLMDSATCDIFFAISLIEFFRDFS